ncbi:MAG: type II toxin-antitoxin system RelB/DinJ family antitoxin [Candidatus Levyibacteriota bacterium]
MNNTLVTFKTDKETKEQLKSFADELGLNSSSLVNMVIKQALREKRLVVSTNLVPTPYLEKIMCDAEDDYKNDRNITHTNSSGEALAHLDGLMKK